MRVRRSKRIWFVALGVFMMVFLFTFLVQKYKNNIGVDAASLAGFDPGYIISDYQMGNYNSMSEADIQSFLTSKNPCSNRDYNYYKSLSSNSRYSWHWKDGHFVCLSEERFGDGEVIGSGETAARIIWRAAQDYRINPQVLIVLLQKETGLITDPIPNNGDYRKAAGYGCPDTAPCASEYYGFKNQVRKAAALFRAVLNGGWTNYPLGNNYIQYNPNAACGGSVVNIRSLATSALYRYTPYQPNAGALAAGYGTAYCGAYGNRNFYLYFQDWFGGITITQKSTRIPDGTYYIQAAKNNSLVAEVEGGGNENGTNIQLHLKNDSLAQQWDISYNMATDDYNIVNVGSGKALDVYAADTSDGTNVQLWETNKTCAQRWKLVRTAEDEIKILSACSNKALDISAGLIKSGNNVQIWTDNYTDAQRWKIMPAFTVSDGLYYISSSIDNNRLIDVSGGSYDAKNGTNVHIWKRNHTAAQQWYIKKGPDGYYTVKNLQSGKLIDVAAAGVKDGTNIQMWNSNDTCAQKWKILRVGQVYEFISVCSMKVIDLSGADTKLDSNIQIYDANNTSAQKWNLSLIKILEEGDYMIGSKLSNNKVVDIAGNKGGNGINVQLYDSNGTSAQKWRIVYDNREGYYKMYNKGVDKVLDVQAAGRTDGTNIQTWNDNGTCAQKWIIEDLGGEYSISSGCSGLMLDVSGANTANGTNIQLYKSNGTNAQKWKLNRL